MQKSPDKKNAIALYFPKCEVILQTQQLPFHTPLIKKNTQTSSSNYHHLVWLTTEQFAAPPAAFRLRWPHSQPVFPQTNT